MSEIKALRKTKKRRFLVMQRSVHRPDIQTTSGKRYKFGRNKNAGQFGLYVDDPAEAEEINARWGSRGTNEVWVKEHDRMGWLADRDAEHGGSALLHHYTFGFSHIQQDEWDRIFKRKVKNGKEMDTKGHKETGSTTKVTRRKKGQEDSRQQT